MSRASRTVLLGGLLLSACHDDPIAPAPAAAAVTPPRTTSVFPACTRHWKNPVSGGWNIAASWTPAGVPTAADIVCLDAVGTYTVTITRAASANAVVIGGASGAAVTLRIDIALAGGGPKPRFVAPLGIEIGAGSTLVLGASQGFDVGYLLNRGVLWHESGGLPLTVQDFADSLENQGTLHIGNAPYLEIIPGAPRGFRNSGTITIDTAMAWIAGGEVLLTGGTLAGTGTLAAFAAQVEWLGGTIPVPLLGGTSRLVVSGGTLSLLNPRVTGAVDVGTTNFVLAPFALPTEVIGDVPVGVTLVLLGDEASTLTPASGGVVRNQGALRLAPGPGTMEVGGPGLINEGTLEQVVTGGIADFAIDSVVNTGRMTLSGHARFKTPGDILRNRGTLTVASWGLLDLAGASFASEAGGAQTGPVTVSNGSVLSGGGSVGDVTVAVGQVEPGGQASGGGGIGTLSAASLTLGAASSVGIDLAGATPGRHDVLAVQGQVLLAGTLEVREVFPYLGGHCGEVLPVITNGPSPVARGQFGTVTGLLPAADRGWRTDLAPNALQLVGHDPSQALSLSLDSTTVTEGGATETYGVCLRSAPTATVTVTPTSAGGQLLSSAPLTIAPLGWSLPQYLPVSAVDDALTEAPPQLAVVTHRVTSTDPTYSGARLGSVDVTIVDNDGTTSLELNILSPPPVATIGTPFTLSLRVLNAGPDVSQGAVVTVPANPALVYLANSGTLGCASDPVSGTSCVLPTAVAGVNTDFTLTFKGLTAGSYPTTITVTPPQTDPLLGNNSRTQTITIN